MRENPAMTKNAATKLNHRGAPDRASQEKSPAVRIDATPPDSHESDGKTERSSLDPPCSASIGFCFAASCAGNQAETMTEATPIPHARAKTHGRRARSRTLTRT